MTANRWSLCSGGDVGGVADADDGQQVAAFDLLHGVDGQPGEGAGPGCGDGCFHFHGFDGRDGLGCNDRVTLGDGEGDDSGERGGDMRWVAAVGFLRRGCLRGDGAVSHRHRAKLPVEDAHHRAHAGFVGFGDRLEPDDQFDTLLQGDAVVVALTQPVEELVG